MTAQYLHPDDRPWSTVLLAVLHGGRLVDIPGMVFEPEGGVTVDWDEALGSWLSTTEKAVVHLARGLSIAEWHGLPPHTGDLAIGALRSIVGGTDVPSAAEVQAAIERLEATS